MDLRPGLLGVLFLSAAACRPTDVCGETGTPCGGNPVGNWILSDSCQDPSYRTPLQRTYLGQPITPARQPPPEPASSDWCADLKYGPGGISALNLPHDTAALVGTYLTYDSNMTYGAFITSRSTASIEFSISCLTRFGYFDSCDGFGKAFADYGAQLGGVKDTSCAPSTSGCLCHYVVEADAAGTDLTGTWSVSGNLLTHFAGTGVLPSQADFCVQGDTMTLWGHDRTVLFDTGIVPAKAPGARIMHFTRIVCGNGMVERGEDCEPPNTPTCNASCKTI